jgi:hypothetical protein
MLFGVVGNFPRMERYGKILHPVSVMERSG